MTRPGLCEACQDAELGRASACFLKWEAANDAGIEYECKCPPLPVCNHEAMPDE